MYSRIFENGPQTPSSELNGSSLFFSNEHIRGIIVVVGNLYNQDNRYTYGNLEFQKMYILYIVSP